MQQLLTEHFHEWIKILQPNINLVCWQRKISKETESYAQQLLAENFSWKQSLEGVVPRHWQSSLQAHLPKFSGKDQFIDDLILLSEAFCLLTDSQGVGVRLRSLSQPMCPRWHVDHVPLRLVTAYVGCGSEWHMGEGQTNSHEIQRMQSGWVALLKGSNWPDPDSRAIWHRSPFTHERRLLCTLDAL